MSRRNGIGAILSAVMLVPMLGCLSRERTVLQLPATRMIAIGGGLCLFDDLTSRELDARLNADEKARLRSTLVTQGGADLPICDGEVLDTAVDCLVDKKVGLVLLIPASKEVEQATAKDVEQRLKGKGLSVLILTQEWKAQATEEKTKKEVGGP